MSSPSDFIEQEQTNSPKEERGASWLSWFAKVSLAFLVLSTAAGVAFTLWPAALTAIANVSFTIPFVNLSFDFAFMNSIGLPAASAIVGAVATASLQAVNGIFVGLADLISRPSSKASSSPALSTDGDSSNNGNDDDCDQKPSNRKMLDSLLEYEDTPTRVRSVSSEETKNEQVKGGGFDFQSLSNIEAGSDLPVNITPKRKPEQPVVNDDEETKGSPLTLSK